MIYRLIVEVENMNDVLTLTEFALNLGASVQITPKAETGQDANIDPKNNQKQD